MLYTLKNNPGLWQFVKIESGENAPSTFTRFGFIAEPVTVPSLDATAYTGAGSDEIEKLAIKAVREFGIDEGRAHRAALIIRYNNPAEGERDFIYRTSRGETFIKSAEGKTHYRATPKTCECPDSAIRGNICKHRIAAWMHEKRHGAERTVTTEYEFLYCLDCGSHHWLEISNGKEICHGLEFNPRAIKNATVKTRKFSSARHAPQISVMMHELGY